MKHAYLIIAHNEFEVLQILICALDDRRNDIYVHIDSKVKQLPNLCAKVSRLFILKNRINVRWGNISQIKAELLLYEEAHKNGPYDFYHLISGTHLPLKSVDEIYEFFQRNSGKCIFSNLQKRNKDYQEILKLHRINICTSGYASRNKLKAGISQFLWKSFIAVQRWLNITINDDIQFFWANNWCSLPQDAVEYLLSKRNTIIKRYRWSFCGDEWFVPTELYSSFLYNQIVNCHELLYGVIERSNAAIIKETDYPVVIQSNCAFARKFSIEQPAVIELIIIHINDKDKYHNTDFQC